jgi:hypothetical protein
VIKVQSQNFQETTHLSLDTRSLQHSTLAPRLLQLWHLSLLPVSCESTCFASRFLVADLSSMGTVKGDTAQSAPQDAIPQAGDATSRPAQATTSIVSSASVSAIVSATETSSTTAKPVNSAQSAPSSAVAPTSTGSAIPGGGAVLIGDTISSDAADSSASATSIDAIATSGTLSPVSVSAANGPSAAVPSAPMSGPSSSVAATRPVKACGRGRKRRL